MTINQSQRHRKEEMFAGFCYNILMSKFLKKKGFTLIELLVVVSIISLLSSIIFASINTARSKARDARRIQDIHQIQNALELYYADNKSYPRITLGTCTGGTFLSCSNETAGSNGWSQLQTFLSPYISRLPHDPKEDPTGYPASNGAGNVGYYSYTYQSWINCNNQGYLMYYQLEIASGPDNMGPTNCVGTKINIGGAGANTQGKAVGVNAY